MTARLAVVPMQRAHWAFAVVALGVCLGGLVLVDDTRVERAAVLQMARTQLRSLGRLAGLRDASMAVVGEPLGVFVQQQGGPMWVTDVVGRAVDGDPAFGVDAASPHRLDAEIVRGESAWALRLSLWRRGWALRSPEPARLQLWPWVAVVSAVAGAAAASVVRRLAVALVIVGGLAQAIMMGVPTAPGLPPPTLVQAWRHGPLGDAFVNLARALPDSAVAIGIGVVVLCSVLVIFDHRRSRKSGTTRLVWGLAAAVGLIGWLEAGLRSGMVAFVATATGATSLAAVLGLWVLVVLRRRAVR